MPLLPIDEFPLCPDVNLISYLLLVTTMTGKGYYCITSPSPMYEKIVAFRIATFWFSPTFPSRVLSRRAKDYLR